MSPAAPAEVAARLFTEMSQEQRAIFLAHFVMHMKKAGELDAAGINPEVQP
ncbi:hypothetical protein [Streptomyces fradiae]|uniref:hypothetical protein n=1 Tax=Streptomyces fradiae TaxID=1906 RepID=UPI00130262CF|nr:hypothetical protein [Streptomyces fradiae]